MAADHPNRSDLLAAAEEALRTEVLPHLDGEAKYTGLLVAAALATARREIDTGDVGARRTLDAYALLYGEDNVARSGVDAEQRTDALSRDLAAQIRGGAYDGDLMGSVYAVLEIQVVERLRLSNPKFLTASGYPSDTDG